MAKTEKFDSIQALRAFAAAQVIFIHSFATMKFNAGVDVVQDFGQDVSFNGLGVKLFFCISGFIIFVSSGHWAPGVKSVVDFMRRRFWRIAPLYWIATVLFAVKMFAKDTPPDWLKLIKSFLFIPYLNDAGKMKPILSVGWTLNHEMFFYAFFALALFFKRQFRVPLIVAFFSGMIWLRKSGVVTAAGGEWTDMAYAWAHSIIFYFIIGLLIASTKDRFFTAKWSASKSMGCSFGLFALCILLSLLKLIPASLAFLMTPTICALSVIFCSFEKSSIEPNKSVVSRWIKLMGDASYSTYLSHPFVLMVFGRVIRHSDNPPNPVFFALSMCVVSTLVGILIYKFVEKRLMMSPSAKKAIA